MCDSSKPNLVQKWIHKHLVTQDEGDKIVHPENLVTLEVIANEVPDSEF